MVRQLNRRVIQGVIEATNENGICVDGAWINYSKFRRAGLPPHQTGDMVTVTCDRSWIEAIDVAGAAPRAAAAAKRPRLTVPAAAAPGRDEIITRLAVLKAAAIVAAAKKTADWREIADRMIFWAMGLTEEAPAVTAQAPMDEEPHRVGDCRRCGGLATVVSGRCEQCNAYSTR